MRTLHATRVHGRRRALAAVAACLLAVLAGGCATPLALPPVRLDGVPYFPQDDLQCGPAALASLLHTAQRPTDVGVLRTWMFTPGLAGTLQQDVLGAARRAGTVPIRVAPTLDAVAAQLALGRPVLVLLNLALPRWPRWHYAVVTAIDARAGRIRVGGAQGEADSFRARDFQRAWGYADGWAIVTVRPDEVPTGLAAHAVIDGVAAFEVAAPPRLARQAYLAALAVHADAPELHFGAGNTALALADLDTAARHFETVLRVRAADAAALNNLAEVRRRQGRLAEGLVLARRAVDAASTPLLADTAAATLAELLADCQASVAAGRAPGCE